MSVPFNILKCWQREKPKTKTITEKIQNTRFLSNLCDTKYDVNYMNGIEILKRDGCKTIMKTTNKQ